MSHGRVVLRGDIVKDDSGNFSVFTEQGVSASHMTAAKVLDVHDCPACLDPNTESKKTTTMGRWSAIFMPSH